MTSSIFLQAIGILFSQALLKNPVEFHPNFNWVECIFPIVLWNLYVLDARHFVRYTCLHHFLLDSISLTCSWTLSQ